MRRDAGVAGPEGGTAALRVDKWLWAARFFKTRSQAAAAVSAGHIERNGQRVKPGRGIVPGDRLSIRRGQELFEVEVVALSARRGPAKLAQALYAESASSRARREAQAAQARAERLSAPRAPAHRPDKQARRRIRELLGRD